MPLRDKILSIGKDMARCDACGSRSGVVNIERSDCSPPRGLILDGHDRPGMGCIVAGINPGRSLKRELHYYAGKPQGARRLYETQVAYFQQVGGSYYRNLKRLLCALDITGPILWTDVVKCQTPKDEPALPSDLVRDNCRELFLDRELSAAPASWPVVATGMRAFDAMSALAPDRVVVGVPHASNRFAKRLFDKLLGPNETVNLQKARDAVRSRTPLAEWIKVSPPKKRR